MTRILVADDDRPTCDFFQEILMDIADDIETCLDPKEAIRRATENSFDVVVTDINFEQALTGIDVLRKIKEQRPSTEVIIVTAFGSLGSAIAAVQDGAFDFISKPFNVEEVKSTVRRALAEERPSRKLPTVPGGESRKPTLIGSSAGMLKVFKNIAYVAPSKATVLIQGESGTGKELVARAVHDNSPRKEMPFVAVNCGALTETLLESELFGHVKGAFTGATADKQGLFRVAHRGTLFLDEISETSSALQVKLLRVLQEEEVTPVGGSRASLTDVRVLAATNHDLEELVNDGKFREDLFYRLNVVAITVPPLRERREDIPKLASHFLNRLATDGATIPQFSAKALNAIVGFSWPGNVRELENTIERLTLFYRGRQIDLEDLPEKFHEVRSRTPGRLFEGLPSLEEIERRYLLHVLAETRNNRKRAAEIMKIDRRTLYRMLDRFGMGSTDSKRPPPDNKDER